MKYSGRKTCGGECLRAENKGVAGSRLEKLSEADLELLAKGSGGRSDGLVPPEPFSRSTTKAKVNTPLETLMERAGAPLNRSGVYGRSSPSGEILWL